jgi:hypothetical protein
MAHQTLVVAVVALEMDGPHQQIHIPEQVMVVQELFL